MCLYPITIQGARVPCGKCIECEQYRSNEWAFRVMLACKNKPCCYITLTYEDEYLPEDRSVNKKVAQLFIKRLRKKTGITGLKYILCGEYGDFEEHTGRPHYHIGIIGWCPDDLKPRKNKRGFIVKGEFLSDTISSLWTYGFHLVEELNEKTAKYICKYMQKFIFNIEDEEVDALEWEDSFSLSRREYKRICFQKKYNVTEPFFLCSKGIGYSDWVNEPNFDSDKIYCRGRYLRIPRYFILKYKQDIIKKIGKSFVPIIEKRFDDMIFARRREKLKSNQLQDFDEKRKKDVLYKFFSKKYVKDA